ncbi:hypothetical protein ACFL35_07825 [Candidatus Riflebacteria bacterium]
MKAIAKNILSSLIEKIQFFMLLTTLLFLGLGLWHSLLLLYQNSLVFNLFVCGVIIQGFCFLFLSEYEIYYPLGRRACFGFFENGCQKLFGQNLAQLVISKSFPPATFFLIIIIPIIKRSYLDWFVLVIGFVFSHHLFISFSDLAARLEKGSYFSRLNGFILLSLFHLLFLCLIFKLLLKDHPFYFSKLLGVYKSEAINVYKFLIQYFNFFWAKL